MRFILILFISIFLFKAAYSQVGKSPYPIIFVHGLSSGEYTWDSALTRLGQSWDVGNSHNLNFVLNALGGNSGNSTNYLTDVIIPLLDENGFVVNCITKSSIYTINFQNFWNQNLNDPRIYIHSNSIPGLNESQSNESAIYKQGFALSILIDSVLRVTGAQKVILVGHSMGGLAIREYLQRKENEIHKWWINPSDETNGHKVAKVVTIGTPHLGSNILSGIPYLGSLNSEAVRDLRYSYLPSTEDPPYLKGNYEFSIPEPLLFHNKDVDCDGSEQSYITGLNYGTSFNLEISLPFNINYTWVTSDHFLFPGGDGVVDLDRQWLHSGDIPTPANISDTLLTNRLHTNETKDIVSIIRGLDEPDTKEFAYNISLSNHYSGFITSQANGVNNDTDFYKVTTTSNGNIALYLNALNSGVSNISILSSLGTILVSKDISNANENVSFYGSADNYFIRIIGNSFNNPNMNCYNFSVYSIQLLNIDGLMAYYPLDENANDYGPNEYNGYFQYTPVYSFGIKGFGLQTYGSNNWMPNAITFPGSLQNDITNGDFSITFWVKEQYMASPDGEAYFWIGDHVGGWLGIAHFNNTIQFSLGSNLYGNPSPLIFPYDNSKSDVFVFYALINQNGIMKAYRDGIFLGEKEQSINVNGGGGFTIAKHWTNNGGGQMNRLSAIFDDIAIYNRALSLSDIQLLYDNALPVELINFTSSINTINVKLQWVTSSEINNAGFDIERKSFEKEIWDKIGFVAGNGNSNERKEFSYTDENLSVGKYNYRLKQIDFNGNFKYYKLSEVISIGVPDNFYLSQNYPNPFNPTSVIKYYIAKQCHVSITVFDILGREIKTLVKEFMKPGMYETFFDASSYPSGVYFYKIQAGDFSETKKMILIK